jgi:hypothetical protein
MSDSSTKAAVITAVLTGVFTVIAGLATYWISTKDPELSFSVAGSPSLPATVGVKRIFVVEIQNSGRKEIQGTYIQLALPGGEISEVATEASPGVKLVEEKQSRQAAWNADLLNPNDTVKISFLATQPSADINPKITVRAPGTTAAEISKKPLDTLFSGHTEKLQFLFIPALAAVLSSFLLLSRTRVAKTLGFGQETSPLDQSEITALVCAACGLHEESERLRFGGSEVTYRGTADYLVQRSILVEPEKRWRYALSLKAMLLFDGLADSAIVCIHDGIAQITGAPISEQEIKRIEALATREDKNPVEWRKTLLRFAESARDEG